MGYPDNVLAKDEQVVLHSHPHWKRLVGPVFVFIIATGVAAFLTAVVQQRTSWDQNARIIVEGVIWAIWLVLLFWQTLAPVLSWRTTHFVITDRRVMFRHGLIDRMVGTGTLIIESASQDPLEFHDIPQVERVHSLLYHEVFDTLGGEESDSRSTGRR